MQQLSLFALVQEQSDFPCYNCVFDRNGRCGHIQDAECYCVRGSFQITHEQAICPDCGKAMEIVQSDFGSDGGKCSCGTHKVFNNRGNRPTALELFKAGRLIGT